MTFIFEFACFIDIPTINCFLGELRTNGEIDYDCGPDCHWINFTVMAYDLGQPVMNSTSDVYIEVMDVNDNDPKIHNLPLEDALQVWENASESMLLAISIFKRAGKCIKVFCIINRQLLVLRNNCANVCKFYVGVRNSRFVCNFFLFVSG